MTKSQDVRFAEAVAELRRVLDEHRVEAAAAIAADFVRWEIREGWRPNARPIEHPTRGGTTTDQGHAYAAEAKEAARLAREAAHREETQ